MIEVALEGRVGSSIVQRFTSKGVRWLAISVAVQAGGKGDRPEWVSIAVFSPLADAVPEDLAKGEKIYCEGKLRLNRWENAEGARANLQVTASRFDVLGRIGRRARKPRRRKLQEQQDTGNNVIPFTEDDEGPYFGTGDAA
jgi:single stranded DNA-binding protein